MSVILNNDAQKKIVDAVYKKARESSAAGIPRACIRNLGHAAYSGDKVDFSYTVIGTSDESVGESDNAGEEPIPTTTDKKTLTIEDMLPFNPSPAKLEHPQTPNQLEKKKSPNSGKKHSNYTTPSKKYSRNTPKNK